MPWLTVSKKNDASPRQESHAQTVQRRRFGVEKVLPNQQDPRGKWTSNWQRPYVVKKAFSREVLEVLFGRIKIVGHVCLLKKGSKSWIEMTLNVHCSNIFIYIYVCKYELLCYLWYYYYTFSMKSLV